MVLNTQNIPGWLSLMRLLRILAPLLMVLVSVLWLFYQAQINSIQSITQLDQNHVMQLAQQMIDAELDMLQGDTLYIANQASLHGWFDKVNDSERMLLKNDLLNFARYREHYDQIRILDSSGHEALRIEWENGEPRSLAQADLQDKSSRYYVRSALTLNPGEVFVSPFDLNVESKVIEHPIKPVIRLATPVVDRQNHKQGLVVLNYKGQRLLDRLRDIRGIKGADIWLLNADGYWLLGPGAEKEWGFMYPERQQIRFEKEFKHAWAEMQVRPDHAQFMNAAGLFSYARIDSKLSLHNNANPQWILVSYIATEVMSANTVERRNNFIMVFIALAILLLVVSVIMTYHGQQRQRSEVRIRESEARFRGLLDSAPDAIVSVDKNGCISLINSQTEKWFGYSRYELVGQPIEQLVPQRYHEHHVDYRQDYTSKPVIRPMGAETELFGLRKDGSEFPVEISLSPVETESGLQVTCIIRDITVRKMAEEAQRQVHARYQSLVTNLPVGVYRKTPDAEGRYVEANPAMLEIFEAESMEELLAQPVSSLYCDANERIAFSEKITHDGKVHMEELHMKTLRGRMFDAAVTAILKTDVDGNIFYDGIIEDISERKQSERHIQQLNDSLRTHASELETINQELEAFSYSVSHDLRAPLRALDGFSRTLLTDYAELIDDRGRDRLNRIRAAAQRMASLIDDLLKLSRVSRAEVKHERIDLTMLANEAFDHLRHENPKRNIEFTVQPELFINGDLRLMRVAISNLLSNACKFTGKCPDAKIEMGGGLDGKGLTYFIRDNGVGFDMAYADKLYGAFQRLHDATEFAGTGIGLATVQRVIHKHGGRIWAESSVGKGATFYFTLDERLQYE